MFHADQFIQPEHIAYFPIKHYLPDNQFFRKVDIFFIAPEGIFRKTSDIHKKELKIYLAYAS